MEIFPRLRKETSHILTASYIPPSECRGGLLNSLQPSIHIGNVVSRWHKWRYIELYVIFQAPQPIIYSPATFRPKTRSRFSSFPPQHEKDSLAAVWTISRKRWSRLQATIALAAPRALLQLPSLAPPIQRAPFVPEARGQNKLRQFVNSHNHISSNHRSVTKNQNRKQCHNYSTVAHAHPSCIYT